MPKKNLEDTTPIFCAAILYGCARGEPWFPTEQSEVTLKDIKDIINNRASDEGEPIDVLRLLGGEQDLGYLKEAVDAFEAGKRSFNFNAETDGHPIGLGLSKAMAKSGARKCFREDGNGEPFRFTD